MVKRWYTPFRNGWNSLVVHVSLSISECQCEGLDGGGGKETGHGGVGDFGKTVGLVLQEYELLK
jgi:hypothetical protein